jgi:hypothetical protein
MNQSIALVVKRYTEAARRWIEAIAGHGYAMDSSREG